MKKAVRDHWGKIASTAAFVAVLLGILAAFGINPRFWAWASDMRQIADIVYDGQRQKLKLLEIDMRVRRQACEKEPACSHDKLIELLFEENLLIEEQRKLMEEKDKLK